ncbi:MAG TPA: YbdD/YjiX family protein [Gemmatimonadaceae bacterium]|jgi:uncharacterized short protein YbdD (DUF466 family)|nr:YbdD/YjiX family protein [Gemmatimonadaceae bacterium]
MTSPLAFRRAFTRLDRLAAVVRRIIGVPDYDRYLAHARRCHSDRPVMTRDEFMRQRLVDRYSRPGARCC